jgi:hypothetical protein
MAESLERSRKKWINEGIFERYWVKPAKKKGPEPPDNPSKDTMQKIGPCTITIEPHVFDVTMYAVKDLSRMMNPPPQPMYRPIIQYGPPMQPQGSHSQTQFQHMQAGPQGAGSQDLHNPNYNHPTQPIRNGHPPQALPQNTVPSPQVQQPPNPPTPKQISAPTPPAAIPPAASTAAPAEAPPAPAKSSDPVIQMLAERAATDQELKALMRIVADGAASSAELLKFQGHIDELTKLLKARQQAAPPPPPQSSNHPIPGPPLATGRPLPPAQPQVQTIPHNRPMQPSPVQHSPYQPPQPQALRSKGPLPQHKPDITDICFEFVGGSGDRFLFPKYSILEFGPGGSIIASFLIVRKGSSADAKSYDPALDYYQPVTIRLYAHQGRQLENLQKVVAPREEVCKYMDDIMDNMTRAEYVLLAMQLPREEERRQDAEGDSHMQNGHPTGNNGVLWTTPATNANGPALMSKPVKRQHPEDEYRRDFVNSIAVKPQEWRA